MSRQTFKKEKLRTWIEIDQKAIAHNYRVFRKLIQKNKGKTLFMAVVKSNAYGHNLLEFGSEAARLGADWLGVDSLTEALALRDIGLRTPILVLGHTLPSLFAKAREKGVSITISSFAQLKEALALKSGKPLKVHIKVDTGMHRQGFQLHELKQLLASLGHPMSKFVVEGLYTHFAEAKNPRHGDNTRQQISEFKQWIKKFHDAGFTPIIHAAATGGALLYPEAHFDMVRIGIGCYGLWPSSKAEQFLAAASGGSPDPALAGFRGKKIKLKPVLSWRAVVSEVKRVKKGERVGYDFTEQLVRDSTLAVIPVGYWHGLPRLVSSKGRVLIHGKSARIVGRVSMDMIVVDVTNILKVKMGDVATLIGRDGKEEIKAGEIARFAETTQYEIVTRLNPLIKKFYK